MSPPPVSRRLSTDEHLLLLLVCGLLSSLLRHRVTTEEDADINRPLVTKMRIVGVRDGTRCTGRTVPRQHWRLPVTVQPAHCGAPYPAHLWAP